MPMYFSEIFADVRMNWLTTEEQGVFLILLGRMWSNENELPNDDDLIAKLMNMSKRKWLGLKEKYLKLKLLHDDFSYLRNNRLTRTYEESRIKSNRFKEMAEAKWAKAKEKQSSKPSAFGPFGEE
ncbi:DUF1376 domain-containing protein [Oryzomonas rubra]|nr:DUF1376 domain-containing protein [Oryzomonas rubra]